MRASGRACMTARVTPCTTTAGRPGGRGQLARACGEVWRSYEAKHKPALVLDLRLAPGAFDVNVTPDKREILLAAEPAITRSLRAALDALWAPSRNSFALAQVRRSGGSGGGSSGSSGGSGSGGSGRGGGSGGR